MIRDIRKHTSFHKLVNKFVDFVGSHIGYVGIQCILFSITSYDDVRSIFFLDHLIYYCNECLEQELCSCEEEK